MNFAQTGHKNTQKSQLGPSFSVKQIFQRERNFHSVNKFIEILPTRPAYSKQSFFHTRALDGHSRNLQPQR